jgi:diacylglycerol kinase family enzyme
VGRLRQDRDFEALAVREVEVATHRRMLRVALDGELYRMESPLRYRVRPRALRVLAPVPSTP